MALIFDSFPNTKSASAFRDTVIRQYGRQATMYLSRRAMDEAYANDRDEVGEQVVDIFPFELSPPIVLVERKRDDKGEEDDIIASVEVFNGHFAGT